MDMSRFNHNMSAPSEPHLISRGCVPPVFPGQAHPPAIIRSGMNYSRVCSRSVICAWLGGKQELVANG